MLSIRLLRLLGLWPLVLGLTLPAMLDSCSRPTPAISHAASTPLAVASAATETSLSSESRAACPESTPQQENTKQVTFYPTYGYKDGDTWRIPMRIWVHKERRDVDERVGRTIGRLGTQTERKNFTNRIPDLFADGSPGPQVVFEFDDHSTSECYAPFGVKLARSIGRASRSLHDELNRESCESFC
jgi:hypothetical protein